MGATNVNAEASPHGGDGLPLLMAEWGGRVPHVVPWSGERCSLPPLIGRRSRIEFVDERSTDRDDRGVLWRRALSRPGDGKPLFKQDHPRRQRRAMLKLLCMVCGEPVERNKRGILWLLRDYREDWPSWPERMGNMYPPVCLPCARISTIRCPALRNGNVAVRARSFISGIYGELYAPGPVPVTSGTATLTFDDPNVRWIVASKLIRTLYDCRIMELDDIS